MTLKRRHLFIASILDVICGLISILTFTFYRPWWDMQYRYFIVKRDLNKLKEKLKKANTEVTDDILEE